MNSYDFSRIIFHMVFSRLDFAQTFKSKHRNSSLGFLRKSALKNWNAQFTSNDFIEVGYMNKDEWKCWTVIESPFEKLFDKEFQFFTLLKTSNAHQSRWDKQNSIIYLFYFSSYCNHEFTVYDVYMFLFV